MRSRAKAKMARADREAVEAEPPQDAESGSRPLRVVGFSLDRQRYGVGLASVERVLPMVAVSPLPGAPDAVLGAINLHGEVVPVLDIRRRLGFDGRDYGPAARLLVARTARRTVALPVDDVHGIMEIPAETVAPPETVLPGIGHVSGIGALADGLLLIHDLDTFLSIDEERQLDKSLAKEHG
jgi:purine-binding chemotaxis protein CheW